MDPFSTSYRTVAVTAATPTPGSARIVTDAMNDDVAGWCQVRVASPSGNPLIYIQFGGSPVTATVNSMPILPGTVEVLSIPYGFEYVSALAVAGTGTIYFTIGGVY
jgi:hypothetical protein